MLQNQFFLKNKLEPEVKILLFIPFFKIMPKLILITETFPKFKHLVTVKQFRSLCLMMPPGDTCHNDS